MKIIVIGHGNFATGIHSSLKLIAGEQEKVDAIDFVEGMSANELKEIIRLRKMLVQDYLEIELKVVEQKMKSYNETILSFCESVRTYLVKELGPVTAFKN